MGAETADVPIVAQAARLIRITTDAPSDRSLPQNEERGDYVEEILPGSTIGKVLSLTQ